jgi:DNA-binding transcriptional ArsR family regulator
MAKRDPFFALADPTRRALIDTLWDDGDQPAGRLAARFPGVSRVAVSKHLKVLLEAELVRVAARGRESWYSVEAAALARMQAAFFARFTAMADASLAALKDSVESDPAPARHGPGAPAHTKARPDNG